MGAPKGGLNDRQRRFVDEFWIDRNATQAYIRAGYSKVGAEQAASRLLTLPKVSVEIEKRRAEHQKYSEITLENVLKRWWMMATADVNELVEGRLGSCRHCHGIDHGYQMTPREFRQAKINHDLSEGKRQKKEGAQFVPIPFDPQGGVGFDPRKAPNTDCPECWGAGESRPIIKDTRKLSPAALTLYAGVKQTMAGMEIKLNSQDKALEVVSRHLGMFVERFMEVPMDLTAVDPADLEALERLRIAMQEKAPKK